MKRLCVFAPLFAALVLWGCASVDAVQESWQPAEVIGQRCVGSELQALRIKVHNTAPTEVIVRWEGNPCDPQAGVTQ